MIRRVFRESDKFKDIKIVNGAGGATMYAGDGGIVIAVG